MNLEPDGDLATFDGSHDGVRTRASPKLIIAPKSAELALRLAFYLINSFYFSERTLQNQVITPLVQWGSNFAR